MNIIEAKNVTYEYIRRDDEGNVEGITKALDKVSLSVKQGDFIAVLGHNGSGKSTFAKNLNAILYPAEGTILVDGKDTSEEKNLWDVRREAGMVFQNPDNQIIGQIVEEDVGFGPENLGVPTKEIWERVAESLKAVGMYEYRKHSPNKLSGGQKQRVSIAGVLAMHPKCIILDEPTAMLDPAGRKEVIRAVRALNDVEGITVILITHYMDEIVHADKVFVLHEGSIAMEGTPREIISRPEELLRLRMELPVASRIAWNLKKRGVALPEGILTKEEFVKGMGLTLPAYEGETAVFKTAPDAAAAAVNNNAETVFKLEHVGYTYDSGPYKTEALKDISLEFKKGEFIGLIGHTGSGKSTLVQLLNGLLKPASGRILYKGEDISEKGYDRKALRSKVGLVFQYPEHQLFEENVFKDVCFGPLNFGLSEKDAELRSYQALQMVGLPKECYYQSPFDLSGGQKRRAAIAGVLASSPEFLILDEPTAGLDPKGRTEVFTLINRLRKETGMTILLISHSMDDVAEYTDRVIALKDGVLFLDGTPKEVFMHEEELKDMGLAVPEASSLIRMIAKCGIPVDTGIITQDEACAEIERYAS